ncbi:rhomboid protease GluP [Lacrimispora xylanisolvens]|jgi:rhomboid protease GluP|uniref:Rhomboid protease GluP n=1 Tax=Lacrimispora xylanisolvens TaxID=384636 RepID=A0A2S6HDN2_9FIRM|nr:rhomboid family intramembrane serine protease [Hungatella xylanolytica]MBE5989514.1 rhomboid family intramembrane serine protease [Paenibacillaceae bacterium]PPK75503.1 rhomboid protease GluP [Hungatella xylanolytica]
MDEFSRRKKALVNIGLIAVNVIYFLYLEMNGSTEDTQFMVSHGAMYAPLVIERGEYYRLITSTFMHFGINHIMNNMLILFILGDNLERALGHIKYLFFYLICGVGANVASMIINMSGYRNVVSAGASGAIFGVIGGLLYAVAVNRGQLEDLSTRQLVVVILCSLYFGFTSTGVDNAAHIAGLIIGIIMGVVLYRRPRNGRSR